MKTNLNFNGQPINESFNKVRNKNKCTYSLLGILQGIIADEELNDMEVMFLDIWIKSQNSLEHDGDVIDLLEQIKDIKNDGYLTNEELDDLKEMIRDILVYGQKSSDETEDGLNELLGLLHGITSDGKLSEGEFFYLDRWLLSNAHIAEEWPANILLKRLKDIKADDIIDEEEKIDLLKTLNRITGQQFFETGSAVGATTDILSDNVSDFNHKNKKICFTGTFVFGKRTACKNKARQKGAITTDSITKDLDVLILGSVPSRDWRFTSFGRKIEQAYKYRESGQELLILSEKDWIAFI